jgi:hypothetical protein
VRIYPPVARLTIIAVVVTIVVDVVAVPRNSQHAIDAADHPTDYAADDSTGHRADRTGRALALSCTVLATAHDALRLRGERQRKNGKNAGSHDQSRFHEQSPGSMRMR